MSTLGNIFSALSRKLDGLVSGKQPTDPLYLSNRTFDQILKKWFLVVLLIAVGLGGAIAGFKFFGPAPQHEKELSPAEVAARQLPQLNHTIDLPTNRDLDTTDVHVDHATGKLVGTIRNATRHEITSGDVTFTVVEQNLTQVGIVPVHVTKLAAGASMTFSVAVPAATAAFAIVRDVRTE